MKLGILTQWYDPETGPASLPGVYAREFIKQGHQVKVLTGLPNYPEGKLYPGYEMCWRSHEVRDEVPVRRVALYPNHSESAVGRILNYTSFGVSATLLAGRPFRDADAIWVYNSPITVALPMLAHSGFGRTPVFLHVQDLWPDSLVESGMLPSGQLSRQVARLVAAIVRFTERRASVIGVISPSVRELILERNPALDASRIVYVPNPTNEQLFHSAESLRSKLRVSRSLDVVEVMYAGAIGEVQGLNTLIDAAELLCHRHDIKITVVGDGISRGRLEQRAVRRRLTNVEFVGRVPQDEIPELIARADIQLVSLAANPFLAYTTPSKIPSLLASGVPIVAQLEGDGADLLRQSGAAQVVRPGHPEDLARAISDVADSGPGRWAEMGRSGRRYYERHLSAQTAATRITDALTTLSAHNSRCVSGAEVPEEDDPA
ncbi:MAG: glycosyltransferase family 4 protein [Acidobacteriota bacterium]|nr:glycosyltransferase family 4 protein [Acidobacteriota bacterium]